MRLVVPNYDFHLLPPVPAAFGRLYLPCLAVAMDRSTGMVFSELLGSMPDPMEKQEGMVGLLESVQQIPRRLRVATEAMRGIIEPVTNNLGISVRVGVLPALEEAKQDLPEGLLS